MRQAVWSEADRVARDARVPESLPPHGATASAITEAKSALFFVLSSSFRALFLLGQFVGTLTAICRPPIVPRTLTSLNGPPNPQCPEK
jgi:hypothetical protein